MKYLCLAYHAEAKLAALPEHDQHEIMDEIREHAAELYQNGYCMAATTLQSVATATTIRVRNGQTMLQPGPFASTSEQLCGFYLIEARDLNDAIRVAANMPLARLGSIEIRPIQELSSA